MELQSNNPMTMSDYGAINWLENQQDKELLSAWEILKSYYEECKDKLKSMSPNETSFSNISEKENIINNIKEKLNNEVYIKESYEMLKEHNVFHGIKNIDEYVKIITNILNKDNHTIEEENIIIKLQRLYNMNLKLGHTARITFISYYNMNSIGKGYEDNDNIIFFKKAVLLSALLHDIGRFYQAIKYNNLSDDFMKKNEDTIDNNEVDHSIAGYYFSIASALEMHKINENETDDQTIKNFITEAIAATVVRYHSMNNKDLEHFECDLSNLEIITNKNLIDNLYNFIKESYNKAKILNCKTPDISDDEYKNFVDNFLRKIMTKYKVEKKLSTNNEIANSFGVNINKYNQLYTNLYNDIKFSLSNIENKKEEDIINSIFNVISKYIDELTQIKLDENNKKQLKKEIENMLKEMLDYDIASSIQNSFLNSNNNETQITPDIRFFISSCLAMTMDADKIDILNQRAIGVYNVGYRINELSVFPPPSKSFIEILNEYFCYNINTDNNIVMDKSIINIINKMDKTVRNIINDYLIKNNINIFDNNGLIKKEISSITISHDSLCINNKEIINNGSLYELLTKKNWIEFLINNSNLGLHYDNNFQDIRKEKIEKQHIIDIFKITIDRNQFDKNTSEMSKEDRINSLKKIIVTDELIENFKKEGDNPIGTGWIANTKSKDSYHLTKSYVSALLWQINQFIFTNMRNKKSLEFIKEQKILEGILEQYKQSDPIVYEILQEYITYSIDFIDFVLDKMIGKEYITGKMLEDYRNEFFTFNNNNTKKNIY